MVVAEDAGTKEIIGFVEIGTMPSPVMLRTEWEGNIIESYAETPYMGNVCVDEGYRRQGSYCMLYLFLLSFKDIMKVYSSLLLIKGIAYRLVSIGNKVALKWGDRNIFVAVKKGNLAACRLYEKLGYELCLDESEPQLLRRSTSSQASSSPGRLFYKKSLHS